VKGLAADVIDGDRRVGIIARSKTDLPIFIGSRSSFLTDIQLDISGSGSVDTGGSDGAIDIALSLFVGWRRRNGHAEYLIRAGFQRVIAGGKIRQSTEL